VPVSVPPGHVRQKPAAKPKLGSFTPIIDAILAADVTAPPKQRHTAKRIFCRIGLKMWPMNAIYQPAEFQFNRVVNEGMFR
jgi:hypothetical protein